MRDAGGLEGLEWGLEDGKEGGVYERMKCMGLAVVLGLRTASMSSFFYEGSFVSLGEVEINKTKSALLYCVVCSSFFVHFPHFVLWTGLVGLRTNSLI